ncbi:MAG: class I SAM-dependent methyltransferase [Paracoccaceae bacterium]
MTALAQVLMRRIKATGPITIAEYMAECLLHPKHGYYSTRDPFGRAGDFVTAPEVSQMFGELIGLCLAQVWLDQGRVASFTLAEFGPGRGTLMADMLRAAARVPGFLDAAHVQLVEASPILRDKQREALADHQIKWLDSADELPDAPLFLVANEFFDALPIRQFVRDAPGWREHQVGVKDAALAFGLSDGAAVGVLEHRLSDTSPGDMVEVCAPAAAIMQAISQRIASHGGVALIIDYGDWRSRGDTLQALKDHTYDDVLAHPGEADLTAHVDFEALTKAAGAVAVTNMTPQGVLLRRLGIEARAHALAKNLKAKALSSHLAAHHRLTDPGEMGTLFKSIALHPLGSALPPGFTP